MLKLDAFDRALLVLAVFAPGDVEFVPEARERIGAVQGDREIATGPEGLRHRAKRSAESPSHSRAVPCSSRARVASGNPHASISAPGRASPSGKG